MQVATAAYPVHLHDNRGDMPETPDRDPRASLNEPPPEPPAQPPPAGDAREREATELAALQRQYSRVSSHRRPAPRAAPSDPGTPLRRFTYRLTAFWSRQISVTVPHESCRDHLGTPRIQPPLAFAPLQIDSESCLALPVGGGCCPVPHVTTWSWATAAARLQPDWNPPRPGVFKLTYR
jgi:hypothetical protein